MKPSFLAPGLAALLFAAPGHRRGHPGDTPGHAAGLGGHGSQQPAGAVAGRGRGRGSMEDEWKIQVELMMIIGKIIINLFSMEFLKEDPGDNPVKFMNMKLMMIH